MRDKSRSIFADIDFLDSDVTIFFDKNYIGKKDMQWNMEVVISFDGIDWLFSKI